MRRTYEEFITKIRQYLVQAEYWRDLSAGSDVDVGKFPEFERFERDAQNLGRALTFLNEVKGNSILEAACKEIEQGWNGNELLITEAIEILESASRDGTNLAKGTAASQESVEKNTASPKSLSDLAANPPKAGISSDLISALADSPRSSKKFMTIQEIKDEIEILAPLEGSILLLGDTGTGKEYYAREIHKLFSKNRNNENLPFEVINCPTLTESLAESELFGHKKGAFTGAISDRIGQIKQADQGTVFFDEIGDMLPSVMAKVLRFFQDKKVRPVGTNVTEDVIVRIIAATNKPETLREDLWYRFNHKIRLPLLSTRGDKAELAKNIFNSLMEKPDGILKSLRMADPEYDIIAASSYPWPGNIRQLRDALHHAMLHYTPAKTPRPQLTAAEVLRAALELERSPDSSAI